VLDSTAIGLETADKCVEDTVSKSN